MARPRRFVSEEDRANAGFLSVLISRRRQSDAVGARCKAHEAHREREVVQNGVAGIVVDDEAVS